MISFDKKKIIQLLQEKKVQNYSFNIVFFLVFSFFVIFAIRPNLVTAFGLQKELQEIKLQNRQFEEQIMQIVTYQSTLETYRDDFALLDEAIPEKPALAKVIEDVRKSASNSGILVSSVNVESVTYKSKTRNGAVQSFSVTTNAVGTMADMRKFFDTLVNQRRIKSIDEIDISTDKGDSGETNVVNGFKINLKISAEYL